MTKVFSFTITNFSILCLNKYCLKFQFFLEGALSSEFGMKTFFQKLRALPTFEKSAEVTKQLIHFSKTKFSIGNCET